MDHEKIKVLFIAGWGRSGSTLLDSILGQIDGFLSVGELCYLWDRGLVENRTCGCGVGFKQCTFWQQVLTQAFGGMDQVDGLQMAQLRDTTRARHALLRLLPGGQARLSAHLRQYTDYLSELYRALRVHTNSRVIVDSSKFPQHGVTLELMPEVDLYVVHLIRDARATAFSWQSRKVRAVREGRPIYMKQIGVGQSSYVWISWNAIIEMLWKRDPRRYLMLRYEDFVSRPVEAVGSMLEMLQEPAARLPFVSERIVDLQPVHAFSGNPGRSQTGRVELRRDERWRTGMRWTDRLIATGISWPLLVRYGYLGR